MLQLIELEHDEELDLDSIDRNGIINDADTRASVAQIIEDVIEEGDEALRRYTAQFDGVSLKSFLIDPTLIERARNVVPGSLIESLQAAADAIFEYHKDSKLNSTFKNKVDGSFTANIVRPLRTVGLYIPGGKASYPSTVLMNAIPAKIAGVERIVVVTPPNDKGAIDPALLIAAKIAGINEIYAVGGAQAIAALAYGTESIPKVDKIVGPGNSYVAIAKQLVSKDVAIDLNAGPSEVLILADETSNETLIAADLIAQAEHDVEAKTFLITTEAELPNKVFEEINKQLAESDKAQEIADALSENGLAVVCSNLSQAIQTANDIAPEHLQIMMDQAIDLLGLIENAGAIFIGETTPVALGDYIAGPSHTLPTAGQARFSSPLSVKDFQKSSSAIYFTQPALAQAADAVRNIAEHEGLNMHAKSIEIRLEG